MTQLKDLFLLDPKIIFLNHGSYGATPQPVFEVYQEWQRELERQPVEFLGRRADALLAEARAALAEYLNVEANEVVYFPNPTTAINMVARNLDKLLKGYTSEPLRPGDQILTTDHEYGALVRTWKFNCQKLGLEYVERHIPLPVSTHAQLIEHFWAGVTERTRVITISHITSPTALMFPIEEVCRRARESGILCIVDGAHAPGQISLDIPRIGADIYTGACHKWLCAPKGSAFLYVRKELGEYLDPLVVSWGYQAENGFGCGVPFIDYHEWQGTRDLAAFLSVPAAIEFQRAHQWEIVRDNCHQIAIDAHRRINQLTGFPSIYGQAADWFRQMFTARLPEDTDLKRLQDNLYRTYDIEVPTISWSGEKFIRASIQGYNQSSDVDALLEALREAL